MLAVPATHLTRGLEKGKDAGRKGKSTHYLSRCSFWVKARATIEVHHFFSQHYPSLSKVETSPA